MAVGSLFVTPGSSLFKVPAYNPPSRSFKEIKMLIIAAKTAGKRWKDSMKIADENKKRYLKLLSKLKGGPVNERLINRVEKEMQNYERHNAGSKAIRKLPLPNNLKNLIGRQAGLNYYIPKNTPMSRSRSVPSSVRSRSSTARRPRSA